jgi:microcystin degradation protein MlrC
MRKHALPRMFSPEEAIEECRRSFARHAGAITLVDVDDVVSAGAPGGNTRILATLAKHGRGLVSYVPIHDPAAIRELANAARGTKRRIVLRGTPGYDMPEVTIDGTVVEHANTDCGRAVRIDDGDLRVVITEHPPLPIHPSFWSALGLEARKADIIVQKNFFHYRMFYLGKTWRHLPVTSGEGATSLIAAQARFDSRRAKMRAPRWTSTSSSETAVS